MPKHPTVVGHKNARLHCFPFSEELPDTEITPGAGVSFTAHDVGLEDWAVRSEANAIWDPGNT